MFWSFLPKLNMVDGSMVILHYHTVRYMFSYTTLEIKGVFISDCIVYIQFVFVLYLILILEMSFLS